MIGEGDSDEGSQLTKERTFGSKKARPAGSKISGPKEVSKNKESGTSSVGPETRKKASPRR